MPRAWWKKPFVYNPPEEVLPNAFIAYKQKPWVQAPPYYVVMHRTLIIDLWIVTLRFDWEKDGKWPM